ncbi:MAG: hypothetical protein V2I51_21200 [Anderseniella sp.]|jgi:hypothetical protein|nr:hypothetical protein [Anderseniella sp.]
MTTAIRTTAIAAVAAITMAVAMASPAQALSKKGKVALGVGLGALAIGAAAAAAHDRRYYEEEDYEYRGGRAYRRAANRCADRYGWETRRWYRCMDRQGF